MDVDNITVGVAITRRQEFIDTFFESCIGNTKIGKELQFIIIDNNCQFDLKEYIEKYLSGYQYQILRNGCIESLTYNQNKILLNSNTDYIVHSNDDVYFKEGWLEKLIDWIDNNDGHNKIAHLSRCVKGYNKSIISKIGYFNLKIQGKDGSDSDLEFREAKCLENYKGDSGNWIADGDNWIRNHIIGGNWYEERKDEIWNGERIWSGLCVSQHGEPDQRHGDSNKWLQEEGAGNFSPENSKIECSYWSLIGDSIFELPESIRQKMLMEK